MVSKNQTILSVMYAAVVGLIILSIVSASMKGIPFWDQMAALRKEGVEMTQGNVDLPHDVVAPRGTGATLQVFFIIFMIVIVFSSIVLCHEFEQGFGQFWLDFPFKQMQNAKA